MRQYSRLVLCPLYKSLVKPTPLLLQVLTWMSNRNETVFWYSVSEPHAAGRS